MNRTRQLIYFKNYFWDFFNKQPEKVKDKIDYVLYLVTYAERIPKKFFDQIKGYDGLFEIRIEFESNIYRIFCCFDQGNLVVLFNGFQKKSQKTPKKEIEKAVRVKNEYFKFKNKGDKNE
jgi:phage-related protein